LLGGAAQETEQSFAEGLAENAQTGEGGEAAGEMGVAAPRERIGQGGPVGIVSEVTVEVGGGGAGGAAPLQAGVAQL